MASFQAKIGWKRQRKRENKNYRYVSFLHDPQQKIQKKIAKKFKKLKKYHYGFISSQNRTEKTEKEIKKNIIFPFRSYPTSYRKFEKNNKKTKKTKKYLYRIISSKNRLVKAEKEKK